jgi:hypothetical protein
METAVKDQKSMFPAAAVRRVIVLLFINLGVAVVFGALTLIYRHSIIDYQFARSGAEHASQSRQEHVRGGLTATLWMRPIPVFAVSLLYIWIAKRFREGKRRAYIRIRIISIIGLAGAVYLIVSAQYPLWLRAVEGVQALVLVALVIAVNRPVIRRAFARR